jgi:hypothetical protein
LVEPPSEWPCGKNRTLPALRAVEITRISKGIIPNEKVALPWTNSVEFCTGGGL